MTRLPTHHRAARLTAALLALATAAAATAADYAGRYQGQVNGRPLTVDLSADAGGGYAGAVRPGDASYPLTARDRGDALAGTFRSDAGSYNFTATLAGDALTLSTGHWSYTLTRARAAAAANPPAGVLELASTPHGRALLVPEPSADSADAALPTLPRMVGGTVTAGDRVADRRHPDCGTAPFHATVNGNPTRGVAFAGPSKGGGFDVSVVYATADAPPAECRDLMAALPHAEPPLQQYPFADGTGTIEFPQGWQCNTRSIMDRIIILGPQKQRVVLGATVDFQGANSPVVQGYRMAMQVWQKGQSIPGMAQSPPPPPPEGHFGEYTDPVTSLQRLIDQNAATARAHNQPVPSRLDAVVASEPVPPQIQVGQAAVILADTTDGTGARRRSLLRVETDPVPDGAGYMMAFNILETDRDRFDRDLPALSAIYRSRHEDPERCQQVGNQRLADGAARNAAVLQGILDRGRMLNRAQNDRFDRIEATIHNQSVAGHRAAVDQAEFLSGQQKFLDTATGTVGSVGYDYSEQTLQHMNDAAQDPDRFQPVHRRDEQYPQ